MLIDFKKLISIELIQGKNFKDTAFRFQTSSTTAIRCFVEITSSMVDEVKELPKVIEIDEYKGDAGNEEYH